MSQQTDVEGVIDDLIVDVLGLDPEEYSDDTQIEDISVDSLLVFELAESITVETGVELPDDALQDLDTIGDLKSYVAERAD